MHTQCMLHLLVQNDEAIAQRLQQPCPPPLFWATMIDPYTCRYNNVASRHVAYKGHISTWYVGSSSEVSTIAHVRALLYKHRSTATQIGNTIGDMSPMNATTHCSTEKWYCNCDSVADHFSKKCGPKSFSAHIFYDLCRETADFLCDTLEKWSIKQEKQRKNPKRNRKKPPKRHIRKSQKVIQSIKKMASVIFTNFTHTLIIQYHQHLKRELKYCTFSEQRFAILAS